MTIAPLILIQMKRMAKIGPITPVFVFMKDTWKESSLPFRQKVLMLMTIYRDLSRQEKFRLSTIFVYNLAYYPILISMIYGIRKLLSSPELAGSSFLHITNFIDMDPFYILPTITVALYYYNFQRFITPENEHTLFSKIRRACQIFLIIWYPFLCCWPAGIVLYMGSNAAFSVLQSTVMKSPWFLSKVNEKILLYNSIIVTAEYDKGTSQAITEAIKKGQQNLASIAIKEDVLVAQAALMLNNLDKQAAQQKSNSEPQQEGTVTSQANKSEQSKRQPLDFNSVQNAQNTQEKLKKKKLFVSAKQIRQKHLPSSGQDRKFNREQKQAHATKFANNRPSKKNNIKRTDAKHVENKK